MPNYNLVIDTSNFKPYDYSNALALLREIRDANYRTEEIANKILEERGKYLLPEDSKYSLQLKSFWEDFDTASENFYNNSNLETMNAIKKMRNRYNAEMVPIGLAVEKYNKALDTILKLGPDAIIGNKLLLDNLDSYYGGLNPLIDYRSASLILNAAAKAVAGLDNALMSSPLLADGITNQYLTLVQKGISGKDALDAIIGYLPSLARTSENVEGVSQLVLTLDNLYSLFAFNEETPENEKVVESLRTGALQGMLAPKYTMLSDKEFRTTAEKQLDADIHNSRESQYIEKMIRQGYIPEVDDNGNIKRDENREILFKFDLEKAKEIAKLHYKLSDVKTGNRPSGVPNTATIYKINGVDYWVTIDTKNKKVENKYKFYDSDGNRITTPEIYGQLANVLEEEEKNRRKAVKDAKRKNTGKDADDDKDKDGDNKSFAGGTGL